jgi:hypothetical protein
MFLSSGIPMSYQYINKLICLVFNYNICPIGQSVFVPLHFIVTTTTFGLKIISVVYVINSCDVFMPSCITTEMNSCECPL